LKFSKILSSLVVFLSLALAGCANVGNQSVKDLSEAEANNQIVKGVTTKNDIKEAFGSPMESTFTDGGLTIWTYQYDDTSAFTAETVGSMVLTLGLAGTKARGTRNELVILFDEQDVVKQFNMSNSPIEAGTGIF
jgi:outer membrane protein assembly factor BamE (lipoprotein component of BamABCDE complex)